MTPIVLSIEEAIEIARECRKLFGAPLFDEMDPLMQANVLQGIHAVVAGLQSVGYRVARPLRDASKR